MRDGPSLLLYWVSGVEGPAGALEAGVVRPATDVVECGEGLLVAVEAAGVEQADLSLTLEGHRLEVRGIRRPPERESDGPKRYLRREIVYAPLERTILLPDDVDEQSLEAEYRDGMLRIRLRRRPASDAAHRVPIR